MGVHDGHRKRMKDKFMKQGLEALHDHEVLELLLFFAIPQGNVNALAHILIDHFGSLAGVLDADARELSAIKGVGEHTTTLLKLIPAIGGRYLQSQGDTGECISGIWELKRRLLPYFYGKRDESVYLLCMDAKRKQLTIQQVADGTVNAAAVNVRKVIEIALAWKAAVVVLAHNHPSGVALPSDEDRITTNLIQQTLRSVSVTLWDHVIFADGDMVSMRESGMLRD